MPEDRPAIGTEIHRRRLLDSLFPGGRLAGDLSELGDEQLVWGIRYASPADAERIVGEIDRRHPPAPPPPAAGPTVADTLAARDALDEPCIRSASTIRRPRTPRVGEKATGVRTGVGETARQAPHAQWLKQ
ncbi:hypothetical protein [Streptomyces sp. NPDC029721]|uniref:hypothetical protein n=1 Tax=Streptomyces sp. NPDC029721 TaxID=3157090 RepID=UPI0033F4AC77